MWEELDDNSSRLKIPEGWIVRVVIFGYKCCSVHSTVIKDRGHTWEIKNEKD